MAELQQQVVKTFSDASKAVRKNYRATDTLLGEGAFGSVWLFEGKNNPESKYAVKILLKESHTAE